MLSGRLASIAANPTYLDVYERHPPYDHIVADLRRLPRSGSLNAYRWFVRARAKTFSLLISGAFHSFGPDSVLEPPIRLSGERQIDIGRDVYHGAVVGANAVVLEDIPAHCVSVGAPARVVKGFASDAQIVT